jgi:hypothetical protein
MFLKLDYLWGTVEGKIILTTILPGTTNSLDKMLFLVRGNYYYLACFIVGFIH